MSQITKRLKSLRVDLLNITQEELAKRTGISRAAISNYEIDRNQPSDLAIRVICEKFNVNETWLRTGEGNPFLTMSKSDEIAKFIGSMLVDETEDGYFKRALISIFSQLDQNRWVLMREMAESLCAATIEAKVTASESTAHQSHSDGTVIYFENGASHVVQLTPEQLCAVKQVINVFVESGGRLE